MLTYEDFLAKALGDARRSVEAARLPARVHVASDHGFVAAWTTDGFQADGESGRRLSRETEPEVEPLLELLDDLGLKRRQVNEVKALFTYSDEPGSSDYHGSWQDMRYKVLSIDALHEKLVEMGFVEPKPPAPGM